MSTVRARCATRAARRSAPTSGREKEHLKQHLVTDPKDGEGPDRPRDPLRECIGRQRVDGRRETVLRRR